MGVSQWRMSLMVVLIIILYYCEVTRALPIRTKTTTLTPSMTPPLSNSMSFSTSFSTTQSKSGPITRTVPLTKSDPITRSHPITTTKTHRQTASFAETLSETVTQTKSSQESGTRDLTPTESGSVSVTVQNTFSPTDSDSEPPTPTNANSPTPSAEQTVSSSGFTDTVSPSQTPSLRPPSAQVVFGNVIKRDAIRQNDPPVDFSRRTVVVAALYTFFDTELDFSHYVTLTSVAVEQESTGFEAHKVSLLTTRIPGLIKQRQTISGNKTHLEVLLMPTPEYFVHRDERIRMRLDTTLFATKPPGMATVDVFFTIDADDVETALPSEAIIAMEAIALTFSFGAALTSVPAIALGGMRSAALFSVERCDFQHSSPGPENIPVYGAVIPIGNSRFSSLIGAAVFNTVLVALVLLGHGLSVIYYKESHSSGRYFEDASSYEHAEDSLGAGLILPQFAARPECTFSSAMARKGFPMRYSMPVALFFLHGTLTSCFTVLAHGTDVPSETKAVIGILCCLWLLCVLGGSAKILLRNPFGAFFVPWSEERPAPGAWLPGLSPLLCALVRGLGRWEDDDLFNSSAEGFTEQFGVLFSRYRSHRHWIMLIEIVVTIATAAIVAVQPPFLQCKTISVGFVCVFGVYFLSIVVLRPNHSGLDLIFTILIAACHAAAAACLVAELRLQASSLAMVAISLTFVWAAVHLITMPSIFEPADTTPSSQRREKLKKQSVVGTASHLQNKPEKPKKGTSSLPFSTDRLWEEKDAKPRRRDPSEASAKPSPGYPMQSPLQVMPPYLNYPTEMSVHAPSHHRLRRYDDEPTPSEGSSNELFQLHRVSKRQKRIPRQADGREAARQRYYQRHRPRRREMSSSSYSSYDEYDESSDTARYQQQSSYNPTYQSRQQSRRNRRR